MHRLGESDSRESDSGRVRFGRRPGPARKPLTKLRHQTHDCATRRMTAQLADKTDSRSAPENSNQRAREAAVLCLSFLLAAFVLFYQLGALPLFNPDEALYAEPAREMLETGEYITTHLNYVVRYTKPPLVIWAMAASFAMMGVTEFAARFFGAACGAVLISITQALVMRYAGLRAGLIAAAALLSAPLFFGTAREAITDMPLSLFIAGGLLFFFRGVVEKSNLFLYLGYMLTGLAVMTKGPVGAILPAAILIPFVCLRNGFIDGLRALKLHAGAAIVLLISLPWFVVEIYVTNGEYFLEFILRENFQRFTANVDSHKAPIWYHVAAMLGGFFPWSLFLPQAIVPVCAPVMRAFRSTLASSCSILSKIKSCASDLKEYAAGLAAADQLALYSLMWALFVLIFFSASVSKLLPYTLPAFPALAILVALEIDRAIEAGKRKRLLIPAAVLATAYGAGVPLAPFVLSKVRHVPEGLKEPVEIALIGAASALAIALILLCARRLQSAVLALAACQIGLVLFTQHAIIPRLSDEWEGSLPAMSRYCGDCREPLFVFDMRKPSVPFYARRQISQVWSWPVLTVELSRLDRAYVLTRARNESYISMLPGMKALRKEGAFLLIHWTNPDKVKGGSAPSSELYHIQR